MWTLWFAITHTSDCLPHMVLRHLNPSLRAFTLCLHGSTIALFSAAFAVQILGRKGP
jgi:hypothetical protein